MTEDISNESPIYESLDKAWEYVANLGGNFSEIWILIEIEYKYNDEGTPEHKLAKYLLDVMKQYVDVIE